MGEIVQPAQLVPPNNEGEQTSGQQLDQGAGFVIPFTEQVVPYRNNGAGVFITGFEEEPYTEITRIDAHSATVRLYDVAAINPILAATSIIAPTTIPRIEFPDELTAITITYNTAIGVGTDSHPASQQSFVIFGTGSGGLSPSSSSQGSASIVPDIQPTIIQRARVNVFATEYTFYMPSGSTRAQILTRLTTLAGATVLAWPQFNEKAVYLTLNGQQVSVSAKADTSVTAGGSLDSGQTGYQWGNGTSQEIGLTTTTKTIPPTIHALLNLTGATSTATAAADADASTPALFVGSVGEQPAITNTVSVSLNAEAEVTPASIPATSPTTIPATGLYVFSLNPGPIAFGQVIFQAIVVDFATLNI